MQRTGAVVVAGSRPPPRRPGHRRRPRARGAPRDRLGAVVGGRGPRAARGRGDRAASWRRRPGPRCRRPWPGSPACAPRSGRAGSRRPSSGRACGSAAGRSPAAARRPPSSTSPASRSRSCGRCTSATGRGRSPSTSSAPTRSRAGCSRSCPAARCARWPATSGRGCRPSGAAPTTWPPPRSCGATWSRSLAEREGVVDLAELREWLARPARRVLAPLPAAARAPPRAARTAPASTGCCARVAPCSTSARPPRCASA